MKKILNAITLVMAIGALMFMQSCKKDETGSQIFYATIQQYNGEKVYIDEPYSCWVVGDKVKMANSTGTIGVDPQNSDRYIISFPNTINGVWGGSWGGGNNDLAALYPASISNSDFNFGNPKIFMEPTQLYEEVDGHQKLLAPMVAVLHAENGYQYPNTSNTMEFKNVCALLKVNVTTSTPITVTRIEVENTGMASTGAAPGYEGAVRTGLQSGRPLWGNFEIAYDANLNPILQEESPIDWNSSQTMEDNAVKIITKEVTLECEHHGQGGVSVSSGGHSFYIFLPPVGYDSLHVTVYARLNGHEMCLTKMSTRRGTFQANTIYPLDVDYPGSGDESWITIDRTNTDLLGPYTVDGTGKQVNFWFSNMHNDGGHYLPPYQYDFIGFHDPNEDHDHFTAESVDYLLDIFEELGTTLLSGSEWHYLMHQRTQNIRFVTAVVASVPGIVLFPDGFSMPATISQAASTAINANKNSILNPYTHTRLSLPDFYKLEYAGCAFLPCIYYTYTDEGSSNESVSSVSDKGYYWENRTTRLLVQAGSNDGSFSVTTEGTTGFLRFVDIIE